MSPLPLEDLVGYSGPSLLALPPRGLGGRRGQEPCLLHLGIPAATTWKGLCDKYLLSCSLPFTG